jgi:hypothetical protein
MSNLMAPVAHLTWFLDSPVLRLLTPISAFVSLGLSIYLFRKTARVLRLQQRHYFVDQFRDINQQWQRFMAFALSSKENTAIASEMLDLGGGDDARMLIMMYYILNILETGNCSPPAAA